MQVIELGAGPGLPGLVCASMGESTCIRSCCICDSALPSDLTSPANDQTPEKSSGASVVLTDNAADVLKLLERNVAANANASTRASVSSLEWGYAGATTRLPIPAPNAPNAPHLIIASECAYCESAIAPLVVTMLELATPGAAAGITDAAHTHTEPPGSPSPAQTTQIIAGFRRRDPAVEERFKALLDAFFTKTSVSPEELAMLPPYCSQANVELYWLQLRPDAAEGSVCAHPNTKPHLSTPHTTFTPPLLLRP